MYVTAFNQQVGLDRQGLFLIGRLPMPMVRFRWPWTAVDATAGERGFLGRYRTFLLDELESVRHRIETLQGQQAGR